MHLVSGQAVIGMCRIKGDYLEIHNPYEIMVTPNDNADRHHITLVRFGSMYEILPFLAPPMIRVYMPKCLCPPVVPNEPLTEAYVQALKNQELKDGKAEVKDGDSPIESAP